MSGHATILDAFNAAAGVTQQALGYADQEKRRLAEIQLQHDSLEETRESQLFLQTLDTTGDDDDLMRQWTEFRDNRRAANERKATGIRATKYYRQAVEKMLGQNEVRMEAQVRGQQIERMQANGRAVFAENLELARENNKGDPQGFIDEAHELIRTAQKNRFISYPESLKLKKQIEDSAVGEYMDALVWDSFVSGKTNKDIDEIFENIDLSKLKIFSITPIKNEDEKNYATTLRAKPSLTQEEADWLRQFDEDIKNDTEGYEEKQEFHRNRIAAWKNAGKDRAKQTWNGYITGKQKENVALVATTYGDALLAVSLGLPGARDMVLNGIGEVRNFENPYLSENDRTEYNEKYNRLLKTLGEGSGGSRGGSGLIKDLKEQFEDARYLFQMGGVLHQNSKTYEQGLQAFRDFVFEKAMGTGAFTSRADVELTFASELRFDEWMGELSKAIKTVDPEFQPKVMDRVKDIIKGIADENKLDEDDKRMLTDQISDAILGRVADMGLNHLTREEWVKWGKDLATRAVGGKIDLMSINEKVENLSGLNDTKKQIKMIQDAKDNPDAIDIYNGQVRHIGNKKNWDTYQEFVRVDISERILGVDKSLAIAGWVDEEGRQDSIIGLPKITITSGPKAGTYIQDTDGKKVITKKYNEETKKWDPIDYRTGEQITSDTRKEEQEKREVITGYAQGSAIVEGRLNEILNIEDREQRREEYEAIRTSPEGKYVEDAVYMRGLDPQTLEPLKSISDARLQELLERNFGHRETISKEDKEKLLKTFPGNSKIINKFFDGKVENPSFYEDYVEEQKKKAGR